MMAVKLSLRASLVPFGPRPIFPGVLPNHQRDYFLRLLHYMIPSLSNSFVSIVVFDYNLGVSGKPVQEGDVARTRCCLL